MCHIETGLKIYEAIGSDRSNVELTVFENCGHFPHLEEPAKIAEHILKFLKRHEKYQ